MSFSKPQFSFSSNFAWLFNVMKHNSYVLFLVKRCILCTKGTNQSANSSDFLVFGSKLTKLLSFLKQKISFSSNFAPLFGIMRHIFSILFLAQTLYTFSKSSRSKYKFGEISPEQSEIWNCGGLLLQTHIKFQLQKYRRPISHDIEEWCKV